MVMVAIFRNSIWLLFIFHMLIISVNLPKIHNIFRVHYQVAVIKHYEVIQVFCLNNILSQLSLSQHSRWFQFGSILSHQKNCNF